MTLTFRRLGFVDSEGHSLSEADWELMLPLIDTDTFEHKPSSGFVTSTLIPNLRKRLDWRDYYFVGAFDGDTLKAWTYAMKWLDDPKNFTIGWAFSGPGVEYKDEDIAVVDRAVSTVVAEGYTVGWLLYADDAFFPPTDDPRSMMTSWSKSVPLIVPPYHTIMLDWRLMTREMCMTASDLSFEFAQRLVRYEKV